MGLFFSMQILPSPFLEKKKKAPDILNMNALGIKKESAGSKCTAIVLLLTTQTCCTKNHLAEIIELELPGGQFN